MIRVGDKKPKLFFVEAHNDMSHFTPSHYTTNDFYYMSLMEYIEKLEFDTFDLNALKVEAEAAASGNIDMILASVIGTTHGQQMDRLIKRAHGQLWQFNAVSSDLTGYVRQVVILGEKRMQRWSWIDAHIKLPILQFTANILNRLRKHKTDKEWADWQVFLDKVHKKTS